MHESTNVMVVEDNFRARRALMTYMSMQVGIQIAAEASNGAEAIRLIECHPPDIILMDMQMPVMDGLEATRTIKKNWPQIKIVALTMYPSYETEARSAGADAFLVKGCPLPEMVSTIHGLFEINPLDNFHPEKSAGFPSGTSPHFA